MLSNIFYLKPKELRLEVKLLRNTLPQTKLNKQEYQ